VDDTYSLLYTQFRRERGHVMIYSFLQEGSVGIIWTILYKRGLVVLGTKTQPCAITFLLPAVLRSPCFAELEYNEDTEELSLTVHLHESGEQLMPYLGTCLHELCQQVNESFFGVKLIYEKNEKGEEAILMKYEVCLVEQDDVETAAESALDFISALVRVFVPALVNFLYQKPVVRIRTNGEVVSIRPSFSIEHFLKMLMYPPSGRA